MRNYQDYYAKTFLNFRKIPEYESDGNNGERFTADILLSFKFYDLLDDNRKRPRTVEEFSISSVVINRTLKTLVNMVEEINNLKNSESTGCITFFESIAVADKNGVVFTFTQKENNDLTIKIEFKSNESETLLIRTSNTQFYAVIIDFVNLTLELINNMGHIPPEFKELTTIRLYNVIAVIPLLP